jgi:predicted kinase
LFQGRPTPFDAIEFNDGFVCTDTFYDLAFLLMDLDSHGLRPLANATFNRYLELRPQDLDALAALPLFLSCRAAIRAHVAASTSTMPTLNADARAAKRREAGIYLDRARAYLKPPPARLVAVAGRSGSGKSTVARRLAPELGAAPGAVIPRSDVIRKRLMGVPELEPLPQGGYTPAVSGRVFAELERRAGQALAAGHSVIADAVFGTRARRHSIAAVAREVGVAFTGLWLDAPSATLEARVAGRTGDASDATVAVVRQQAEGVAPPAGGEAGWHVVDGTGDPDVAAGRAWAALNNS